jgi:hypothetical protein
VLSFPGQQLNLGQLAQRYTHVACSEGSPIGSYFQNAADYAKKAVEVDLAIDFGNPTSTRRQQSSVYAGKQRVFLVRLPIGFGTYNSALLISLQSSSISLQLS